MFSGVLKYLEAKEVKVCDRTRERKREVIINYFMHRRRHSEIGNEMYTLIQKEEKFLSEVNIEAICKL